MTRQIGVALAALGLVFEPAALRAATQGPAREHSVRNGAIEASILADGTYQLRFVAPGWTLRGRLSGPVVAVHREAGTDKIGPYHALSATYDHGGRTAEMRVYDRLPVVLLRDAWNAAAPNEDPFPAFQRLPAGLLRFSYQAKAFGTYEFGAIGPEGPAALFDQHGHVMLLSPADHFLVSQLDELPDGGADSRIADTIRTLPAGLTHGTLIVGGSGVNAAFAVWGRALLALSGKRPPTNESGVILAKLGYWTDNGAVYYYHFEPRLGYAGTLLAVRDEFKRLGIPLGYLQLDSWWYPKSAEARWDAAGGALAFGEYRYQPDTTLFPNGLVAFQRSLGLPIVTHARWIAPASPYHREFAMSGNVIIDPAFWKATATLLHDAGVVTYEQDWLNQNALPAPTLHDPEAFLGNMSAAMNAAGINIQYCMPLPAHYMASTRYPNVETIRTSDDRLTPQRWDEFLYDSRLASAVGLWPWTDVFMSSELPNLIVATLSAGPVGVGDSLGGIDAQHLLAAIRGDGVIIKPDAPLLPIDAMYAQDAAREQTPMVAAAETRFGGLVVPYVFSYPRRSTGTVVSVSLHELGLSGPAYAYDWIAHRGSLVPAGGTFRMPFRNGFAYDVLVPVNRAGLALLGDLAKIVPLGRQRIATLANRGTLRATIAFGAGEDSVVLSGYAAHQPRIVALRGTVRGVSYDRRTKIFQAHVARAASGTAELEVNARR